MINKIQQWWKSRTIKTATIIALLGIVETNFMYLQGLLGEHYGLTWVVFAVIMGYLRHITTTSIQDK